jgi:hypothetical protein
MSLPRAIVLGPKPRGKLGPLRVRVACPICDANPMDPCDDAGHQVAEQDCRRLDWHYLWLLLSWRESYRARTIEP